VLGVALGDLHDLAASTPERIEHGVGCRQAGQGVGDGIADEFDARADEASGNGGCNMFSGPYEVSGTDAITLGPFAQTLRGCNFSDQEQQYMAALGLAETYQVTGNQLTLFRDGGTIAVTAQRAPS